MNSRGEILNEILKTNRNLAKIVGLVGPLEVETKYDDTTTPALINISDSVGVIEGSAYHLYNGTGFGEETLIGSVDASIITSHKNKAVSLVYGTYGATDFDGYYTIDGGKTWTYLGYFGGSGNNFQNQVAAMYDDLAFVAAFNGGASTVDIWKFNFSSPGSDFVLVKSYATTNFNAGSDDIPISIAVSKNNAGNNYNIVTTWCEGNSRDIYWGYSADGGTTWAAKAVLFDGDIGGAGTKAYDYNRVFLDQDKCTIIARKNIPAGNNNIVARHSIDKAVTFAAEVAYGTKNLFNRSAAAYSKDNSGKLIVSCFDSSDDLWILSFDGSSWTLENSGTALSTDGTITSIAMNETGRCIVAWNEAASGRSSTKVSTNLGTNYGTGAWSAAQTISGTSGSTPTVAGVDISLDALNSVAIFIYTPTNAYAAIALISGGSVTFGSAQLVKASAIGTYIRFVNNEPSAILGYTGSLYTKYILGHSLTGDLVSNSFTADVTPPLDIARWKRIESIMTPGTSTSTDPILIDINDDDGNPLITNLTISEVPTRPDTDGDFESYTDTNTVDEYQFVIGDRQQTFGTISGQTNLTLTNAHIDELTSGIAGVSCVVLNDEVLDSSAYSVDLTSGIITLNSSALSGDVVTVTYDLGIEVDGLELVWHLSREGTGETSPSVSECSFIYEV